MTHGAPSRTRQPLLAISVYDARRVRSVLAAVVVCVFLGWAITSILRGAGAPFQWAIYNLSLGELRVVLWGGTSALTAGIVALGCKFVGIGRSLWRDIHAESFGLRFTAHAGGAFDKLVRWYGVVLVVAGTMMIPLGASLLVILAQCRYMRG